MRERSASSSDIELARELSRRLTGRGEVTTVSPLPDEPGYRRFRTGGLPQPTPEPGPEPERPEETPPERPQEMPPEPAEVPDWLKELPADSAPAEVKAHIYPSLRPIEEVEEPARQGRLMTPIFVLLALVLLGLVAFVVVLLVTGAL